MAHQTSGEICLIGTCVHVPDSSFVDLYLVSRFMGFLFTKTIPLRKFAKDLVADIQHLRRI